MQIPIFFSSFYSVSSIFSTANLLFCCWQCCIFITRKLSLPMHTNVFFFLFYLLFCPHVISPLFCANDTRAHGKLSLFSGVAFSLHSFVLCVWISIGFICVRCTIFISTTESVCMELFHQCTWFRIAVHTFEQSYRGCEVKNIYLVHYFQSSSQFLVACVLCGVCQGRRKKKSDRQWRTFRFCLLFFKTFSFLLCCIFSRLSSRKVAWTK